MAKYERKTMNAKKVLDSSLIVGEDKINIKQNAFRSNMSSSSSGNNGVMENVLILQGGGSLGAFGCGVFKALAQKNVKIDIIAGTSIGGVNAAIIAGSKNAKHPEQLLEEFWLELADSFVDLDYISPFLSPYLEQLTGNSYHSSSLTPQQNKNESYKEGRGI